VSEELAVYLAAHVAHQMKNEAGGNSARGGQASGDDEPGKAAAQDDLFLQK